MAWADQLEQLIAPTPSDLDLTPIVDAIDRMALAQMQLGELMKMRAAVEQVGKNALRDAEANKALLQAILSSLQRIEAPREIVRDADGRAVGTKLAK